MGWWGAEIMAGDEPLDDFGSICDVCVPGEYKGGNDEVLTRESLNRSLPAILQRIEKENKGYQNGKRIALQVLGVVIMERGARMPKTLRAQIIKAAQDDEWAQGDKERRAYEDALIAKVRAYKSGTPTKCDEEYGRGLVDKIAAMLGRGCA